MSPYQGLHVGAIVFKKAAPYWLNGEVLRIDITRRYPFFIRWEKDKGEAWYERGEVELVREPPATKEFIALEEPFPGGDAALTEVIDNQPKKDMKYDADKPRMDLLLSGCPLALEAVSSILTFGAKKYSAHSWQTVERGDERYLAALLRHLTAHAKGEKLDPESGMSHLAHAACNAMFILELELKK